MLMVLKKIKTFNKSLQIIRQFIFRKGTTPLPLDGVWATIIQISVADLFIAKILLVRIYCVKCPRYN